MTARAPIALIDLAAQRRHLGTKIDRAVAKVIDHGGYILGPEVGEFERKLAAHCGCRHAIGCGNGTDAIALAMLALGTKARQAVLLPSFTFASTAEVVAWLGAIPVMADVDERTFNVTVASLERALGTAKQAGLEVVGVIAVDLFGQMADYDAIHDFAKGAGLWVIADSAQAFGASSRGRKSGSVARVTTTSFFPAKPLGCYGDGGAIFTDDDGIAEVLRSLRVHGKGTDKYDNVRIGMNSRLDTIQAAILIEKLAVYEEELVARQRVADRYAAGLGDVVAVPYVAEGNQSVWAQYTLRLKGESRSRVAASLTAKGVPTAIYYPKPLHQQTAYRHYPVAGNGLPVSERIAQEVLSLPMHPYLDAETQDYIIGAVREAVAEAATSKA